MELIKRVSKIQRELVCKKNQYNNFGRYSYRSLEDIFDSLKEHLNDSLVVRIEEDMVVLGDRFYVKCKATVTDGKDSISAVAFAREAEHKKGMDSAQVTISTSSYAAKSAMQKLFMLDDTANVHEVDAQDNTVSTLISQVKKLMKDKKIDQAKFLEYFKVSSISELNYEQQVKAVEMLKAK